MEKLHFKFYFLLSASLAVVFGAILYFSFFRGKHAGDDDYIGPRVAPIVVGDQNIEFPYTDENKDETLIIKTNQKTYNSFNGADVYVSITNTSKNNEKAALLFYFQDDPQKDQLDSINPSLTTLEKKSGDKWEFMNFFKDNIKLKENLLGRALSKRQSIPANLKVKAGTQVEIAAGDTMYFKSKIAFAPGSSGEFWIEAVGSNGGYGLLDPWYNSGWSYRKKITIDKNKVSGTSDLSNFPVLISSTDSSFKHTSFGGNVASASAGATGGGGDFVFTSSDGTTKLDHEIEKYASSSGELLAWVEVPTLSVSADTSIYVYYGGPSSGATNQNKTGVWDANYLGVWHLKDGTTLSRTDSTTNANNLDLNGTPSATTGKIDGGISNFADANYLSRSSLTGGGSTNTVTISAWINATSLGVYKGIFESNGLRSGLILSGASGNPLTYFWQNTADEYDAATGLTVSTRAWHYAAVVITPTAATVYLDDKSWVNTKTHSAENINSNWQLGRDISNTNLFWPGTLDEVRISKINRSSDWIKTEYNNQSKPSIFYTVGGQEVALRTAAGVKFGTTVSADTKPGWYQASGNTWSYRKKITIDKSKVSGTSNLSNFPVLISGTDTNLKHTSFGGNVASASAGATGGGGDFVFTSSDGTTKLDHEIEKYASSSGELLAWVEVPTLSVSADTSIYVYYGGPSSGATNQNKTGVWDADYKGVWHLPNGNVLTALDSTTNANDATINGQSGNDMAANGKVDGGAVFDSVDSSISKTDNASLKPAAVTVSAWVKLNGLLSLTQCGASSNNFQYLVFKRNSQTGNFEGYELAKNDNTFEFGVTNNASVNDKGVSTTVPVVGRWFYLVGTFSQPDVKLYVDGSLEGTDTHDIALDYGTRPLFMGRSGECGGVGEGNWDSYMNGLLDEVRISSTARSADWIKTEYNNQFKPSTFYTVGGQEARIPSSPGIKIRGGVQIK